MKYWSWMFIVLWTFACTTYAADLTTQSLTQSAAKIQLLNNLTGKTPSKHNFGGAASGAQAPVNVQNTGQSAATDNSQQPLEETPSSEFDYSKNQNSEVFGANLFNGSFSKTGAARFNPDYVIQSGDSVLVRLWGGYSFDAPLIVDPQGNIFIANVGPVHVLGVQNQNLGRFVEAAVRAVYTKNVYVYASLDTAQPVRVYVGGFVNRPGLYAGTSLESVLNYLDRAGGVDPERGSFINIQVKRGETLRATLNLYDFLLRGYMPPIQLADGDVIYVMSRKHTVTVTGLADNAKRFEFDQATLPVKNLVAIARPQAAATHVRVNRNTGTTLNTEYYALSDLDKVLLNDGDSLEFTADKKPGTITVRVEGEHGSPQEYVLPYGAKLKELMQHIEYYPSADKQNIQLFRKSVQERQRQMLGIALERLQSTVLTARSATNEESGLRQSEAEMMLSWIEKAKKIEPSGQVVVSQAQDKDELLLENGDVIKVPKLDGLVLVSGEVLFPNTIAFDKTYALEDYIKRAGGYTQSADTSRIVVAHRDGSFEDISNSWKLFGNQNKNVVAGDQLFVLPKVQTKSIEVTRGITQIVYQLAIAAAVIVSF